MKEIREILKTWKRIKDTGIRAALATVVNVEGSSYRRPGARMLVMDDGNWVGGISGGCLEGDALKKARISILNEQASLVRYDTTDDDPYQIGVGLGCQGIIDVLIQPMSPANNYLIEMLESIADSNRREPVHILTILNNSVNELNLDFGKSFLFRELSDLNIANSAIEHEIKKNIRDQHEKPSFTFSIKAESGEFSVSYEKILPEIHLVLAGSQYDLAPFAEFCEILDWKLSIAGNVTRVGRILSNLNQRNIIYNELKSVTIDSMTAVILMAHDYKTDLDNLKITLQTDAGFLGILGPRKRADKMFAELKSKGIDLESTKVKTIHAPVGLDIGAASPEEIALSIVSGIKASFNNRAAGYLKDRKFSIHALEKLHGS